MKRILALLPVLALSLFASGVLLAQDNPRLGTWKLNVAKSKFTGQQPPKSETRTIEPQGGGEKVAFEGVRADGTSFSYTFSTNNDGKDVPIAGGDGPLGADAIATKRVDASTMMSTLKKGGRTLGTTKSVVSKDGKVTTNTTKGTNAQGQSVSITTVWDKQ